MSTWPTCPATKGFMMPIRTVCLDDDALAAMFPAAVEPRPARRTNNRLQVYTDRFGAYMMGSIVQFIQANYSDQLLDDVLTNLHKLACFSCCCLTGVVTANHALRGDRFYCERASLHIQEASFLPYGAQAYHEFTQLGNIPGWGSADFLRYERLKPVLHEEMARRCRVRAGIIQTEKKEGI